MPLQEVAAAEDGLLHLPRVEPVALRHPHPEHLARVVPLVEGGGDVEALVALQPDELGSPQPRQDLGDLGLPHAGVALDEEGLLQVLHEEQRRGDGVVGDVALAGHRLQQGSDLGPHSFPAAAAAAR
jgi:hypothetical protein